MHAKLNGFKEFTNKTRMLGKIVEACDREKLRSKGWIEVGPCSLVPLATRGLASSAHTLCTTYYSTSSELLLFDLLALYWRMSVIRCVIPPDITDHRMLTQQASLKP